MDFVSNLMNMPLHRKYVFTTEKTRKRLPKSTWDRLDKERDEWCEMVGFRSVVDVNGTEYFFECRNYDLNEMMGLLADMFVAGELA
jgi:replication fork clamp-binding protein CrfC